MDKKKIQYLVRMFDMNTKSQLLQDSSFSFDDLRFQREIILIWNHGLNFPAKKKRKKQN